MDEWTVNTNEATTLALVDSNSGDKIEFEPTFTYPIYGEKELIYGYENLKINVEWDATSMLPLVECNFDRKITNAQNDPLETMMEYFDEQDTCSSRVDWEAKRKNASSPPGTRVASFTNASGAYDVYKTKITTEDGAQMLKRVQPLVLFLIEAGSFIDGSDDMWELYLVYKTGETANDKLTSPRLVAFATIYSYFHYESAALHDQLGGPETKELATKRRQRISQFVVLPPYQKCGIGAKFYSTLYDLFLQNDTVFEVTVEDPSEAFDDLRDRCDLQRLLQDPEFKELQLPLEIDALEKLRKEHKMVSRQFYRCVEMGLLLRYTVDAPKSYRLFVKRRLYERNHEVLDEMDRSERKSKLAETYDSLVHDYARILEPLVRVAKRAIE